MMELVSPATLPENYSFEVDVEGQCLMVTVPAGGVNEGQKISVPFPSEYTAVRRVSPPVGFWKDGLCGCFRHGVIHPLLWNARWCPMIAMGQIMHRLKLTWLGNEGGTTAQTNATFRTLLWITFSYFIIRFILFWSTIANAVTSIAANGSSKDNTAPALHFVRLLVVISFGVFLIYIITKTRGHIRMKYRIPEAGCHGCEDCCCAFWCTCCTVAQMGRHTADYDTYAGLCCSETGQPPHVPSVIVEMGGNRFDSQIV